MVGRTPGESQTLLVERRVQNSICGLEARLLRTLRPLATGTATTAPDNISLLSPAPATVLAVPTDRPLAPCLGAENATSQAAQHPPLPGRMKQWILRGEYIEFDYLLPESLYPARYGASPSPAFTLRLSNDPSAETGGVVISQQKPASNASSPTCQPGRKPGICTHRSSLLPSRSALLLCSPTKSSSVALAFASPSLLASLRPPFPRKRRSR